MVSGFFLANGRMPMAPHCTELILHRHLNSLTTWQWLSTRVWRNLQGLLCSCLQSHCLSYFSHCCDKINKNADIGSVRKSPVHPGRRSQQKSLGQQVTVWLSRSREKWNAWSQLPFTFLYTPGSQPREWCCPEWCVFQLQLTLSK